MAFHRTSSPFLSRSASRPIGAAAAVLTETINCNNSQGSYSTDQVL